MSDKLGILVTTDKFKNTVIGIAGPALKLEKKVSIFLTDHGAPLVKDEDFLKLIGEGAEINVCGHSAEEQGIKKEEVDGLGIGFTTQFENAMMAQDSTRYLVF